MGDRKLEWKVTAELNFIGRHRAIFDVLLICRPSVEGKDVQGILLNEMGGERQLQRSGADLKWGDEMQHGCPKPQNAKIRSILRCCGSYRRLGGTGGRNRTDKEFPPADFEYKYHIFYIPNYPDISLVKKGGCEII